ncbi:MAG: hypothetical protein ABMA64_04460 [Myxococcota bacterium]
MTPRWIGGGLWVEHAGDAILIDAPTGAAAELGEDLGRLRAVVLTTGRARSLAGLLELLSAAERFRGGAPLELHLPLGEERGAAVAEVWAHHWDAYPLVIDAQQPGSTFSVGPFDVSTAAVQVGDPRFHPERVEARLGLGLRISTGAGGPIAVLLGAAPDPGLHRLCAGAELAVIEVGVAPWPRVDRAWRLRTEQALAVGAGARQVWLVGDDGQRLALPES